MKKLPTFTLILACGFLSASAALADDLTISDIMKKAHKEGLLKRVQPGDASAEDRQQLLEFYQALAKLKPPKGDQSGWDERTAAMIGAAQAAVDGDVSKLKSAVNCRDCHNYHRPD